MKKTHILGIFVFCLAAAFALGGLAQEKTQAKAEPVPSAGIIQLPTPRFESGTSIEKALNLRRSVRAFAEEPLSLSDISQILWAAQGITAKMENPPAKWNPNYEWQGGRRTAPSAGALYPMELYVAAGNVAGLAKGIYKYIPKNHSLEKVYDGDNRAEISDAALKQASIKEAPASIIMAGVYERTSIKYGTRTERYVHIEVGAIGENIYLQGIALGIGTVMIGAFQDEALKKVLALPADENPLAIMPLGKMPKK